MQITPSYTSHKAMGLATTQARQAHFQAPVMFSGLDGVDKVEKQKRRFYVIHSGMNDDTNHAAHEIRKRLLERGLPESDIIVLPTPYRRFYSANGSELARVAGHLAKILGILTLIQGFRGLNRGTIGKLLLLASVDAIAERIFHNLSSNIEVFKDSADSESPMARESYYQFKKALKERGVTNKDEIVWIGHSAGGQMGLTIAEQTAKITRGYRILKVITLGSPIMKNNVPDETNVINYVSDADAVLCQAAKWSTKLNYCPVTKVAPETDIVREYSKVGHSQWYKNDEVMDQVFNDIKPEGFVPPPRPTPQPASDCDMACFTERLRAFWQMVINSASRAWSLITDPVKALLFPNTASA